MKEISCMKIFLRELYKILWLQTEIKIFVVINVVIKNNLPTLIEKLFESNYNIKINFSFVKY